MDSRWDNYYVPIGLWIYLHDMIQSNFTHCTYSLGSIAFVHYKCSLAVDTKEHFSFILFHPLLQFAVFSMEYLCFCFEMAITLVLNS